MSTFKKKKYIPEKQSVIQNESDLHRLQMKNQQQKMKYSKLLSNYNNRKQRDKFGIIANSIKQQQQLQHSLA